MTCFNLTVLLGRLVGSITYQYICSTMSCGRHATLRQKSSVTAAFLSAFGLAYLFFTLE